eukprot:7788741-Heterocapsa_arctica.AAC.1
MPCNTIVPVIPKVATLDPGPVPFRRKPRFDGNVFIEVVVDTPFQDYRYAISKVRTKPLRPVQREPNTMYAKDLISQAVA